MLSRARISLCRAGERDGAAVDAEHAPGPGRAAAGCCGTGCRAPRSAPGGPGRRPSVPPAPAPDAAAPPASEPGGLPGGGKLEPFHPQVRLGGGDRRLDEGQGVRRDGGFGAGDVDDAQQGTGIRIVERHGRAAPRVDGALVVFGAGDLDAAAQGQRGAGGAGAHGGLGPVGAGDEHHSLGAALHGGVPFDPEQPAHLVPDGHQHAAVVAGQDQEFVDHGHDRGQRVLPAVFLEFLAVHGQRGFGVVRVGVQLRGAPPGFPDQAAEPGSCSPAQAQGVQLFMAGVGVLLAQLRAQAPAGAGGAVCSMDRIPH